MFGALYDLSAHRTHCLPSWGIDLCCRSATSWQRITCGMTECCFMKKTKHCKRVRLGSDSRGEYVFEGFH